MGRDNRGGSDGASENQRSHELPDKYSPAGHELQDNYGSAGREPPNIYNPSPAYELGGQDRRFEERSELVGSWPQPRVGELQGSRFAAEAPA